MQQQKERGTLVVQEGWKQPVAVRDAAIAIGFTTLLLCLLGWWQVTRGHLPELPIQFQGGFLIFLWTLLLCTWQRLLRRRTWCWREQWPPALLAIAYTLSVLPQLGVLPKNHWLGTLGTALLILSVLRTLVVWQRPAPPCNAAVTVRR